MAVARLAGPFFHQHVVLRAMIMDELLTATVDGFLSTRAGGPHGLAFAAHT